MSNCATWFNQKTANFLGDFKEERQSEANPSPMRAIFRIVFVVLILVGFVLLLVYHFLESPDVWVEQINLKVNKNFTRCSHYGGEDCKEAPFVNYDGTAVKRRPVVCPCNNTNLRWRDYLRIYTLHQNSTKWRVEFVERKGTIPSIRVPLTEENFTLLSGHVVKSTANTITTDNFCNWTLYWPDYNAPVNYPIYVCENMASALLPVGPSAKFNISNNRTTEFFESPNLLNLEAFRIRVVDRARESILNGRLDLDMINLYDRNFTKACNLYANMLTQALNKIDTEEWESYYRSAIELREDLNFLKKMKDSSPWMIYLLRKPKGQTKRLLHFLHLETDWEKYEKDCEPLYCEETKKMNTFRQVYRAFGLLGGVATLVLGLVTVLLWPAFGLFLRWCCNTPAAAAAMSVDVELPEAHLWPGGSASDAPDLACVVSGNPASISQSNFRRVSGEMQAEPLLTN